MLWQQFPLLNHLDSDICSSSSLKQRTRSASQYDDSTLMARVTYQFIIDYPLVHSYDGL
mgnify:FL=1